MYRIMRVTAVLCVLFVTAPAWAQQRMRVSGGAAAAHGSVAHAPATHGTPVMHTAPGSHAYLPPHAFPRTATRIGAGVPEARPLPPSFVPGSPLAAPPQRFTGFSGGHYVTYAAGSYYPHVVVYPIGGYYPTYYQTYPWAGE